jgi:NDP-sugar pyrophosphorylase family protein
MEGLMRAFILAGGVGSRLSPYTLTIPKPMLPVGNVPILEVVIKQLVSKGFQHITISLGHLPHLVRAHVDNLNLGNKIKIDYVQENSPMGTAGALSLISPSSGSKTKLDFDNSILVMNGDLLTDLNYLELMKFHTMKEADITLATAKRSLKIEYGVIEKSSTGEFIKITEKPFLTNEICLGIYVISYNVWKYLSRVKLDMPELINKMIENNNRVFCFESELYWQDIGNLDEYVKASSDFQAFPERFITDV